MSNLLTSAFALNIAHDLIHNTAEKIAARKAKSLILDQYGLPLPKAKKAKKGNGEWKSATIAAGGNAKTIKGDKTYYTAIMYLAPYTSSGLGNLCAMAETAACHKDCLFVQGRAAFTPSINPARIRKTRRYFADRKAFMQELVRDISRFEKHCAKRNLKPAVRLNGTSDIQWEIGHSCEYKGVNYASIFDAFPAVTFYDYTKIMKRSHRALPSNYSLTLSYSAANPHYASSVIKAARETETNVAVVYRTKKLRDALIADGNAFLTADSFGLDNTLLRPIINGDETDMRFLDAKGVIVGLYAKGSAKKDASGFVVG